ncbi:MAG: hypothetical protein ACJ77A_14700 [Actinomycetota bacterium]
MATRDSGSGAAERFSLTLDGPGLTWANFVQASEALDGIMKSVDRSVSESAEPSVRWIIRSISKASPLVVEIEGRPARNDVKQAVVRKTVGAVANGIRRLQRRAERPPFFSDRALEKAKMLADLRGKNLSDIRVRKGKQQVEVTSRLSANVDELIGPKYSSLGSVEGTLEAITIHNKHEFSIYDSLTGRRVRCNFGQRVDLDEVKQGFGDRVAAYGTIHYRATGEPVSVDVESFEVFPPATDLPSADDVQGILGG